MRSILGLGASALAALAAVVASLDGDLDIVPFFVGLTFLGGVEAWAAHPPFIATRRQVTQAIGLAWLLAAAWVGALLVMLRAQSGGPAPGPEATYLGLTATVYHLAGLYGGMMLAILAAFGREGWIERSVKSANADEASS